jgi:WD40 repeat protein
MSLSSRICKISATLVVASLLIAFMAYNQWRAQLEIAEITKLGPTQPPTHLFVGAADGGHDGIASLSFAPTGTLLAASTQSGAVALWDLERRAQVRTLKSGDRGRCVVSFSAHGDFLVAGFWNGEVVVLETKTWSEVERFAVPNSSRVVSISSNPKRNQFAVGLSARSCLVLLHSIGGEESDRTLAGHSDCVEALSFSPDGMSLATANRDGSARIWNVATGKARHVLIGPAPVVISGIAYSTNGKLVATASPVEGIRIFDSESAKLMTEWDVGSRGGNIPFVFSRDGSVLYVAVFRYKSGTVSAFDTRTGVLLNRIAISPYCTPHPDPNPFSAILAMAASPDGNAITVGTSDGTIGTWDAKKLVDPAYNVE